MMPNVGIVIACLKGLFYINDSNDTVHLIESGCFISVDTYKDTLYAYYSDDDVIQTYSSKGSCPPEIYIDCRQRNIATIAVNGEKIVVSDYARLAFEVLSLTGETLHTYKYYPRNKDNFPRYQRLYQADTDGALLIVEEGSNQLLLLDKSQNWNVVDIDHEMSVINGTMYVNNVLYVQGCKDNKPKLCKYTAK